MIRPLLAAALFATTPAAAQEAKAPTPYDRAIAAGYKALTLCNGMYAAGRTPAQIDADELKGIYPEYDAIVPTLAAVIDAEHKQVSVSFDPALSPRVAAWRGGVGIGCMLRPIGAKTGFGPVYGEDRVGGPPPDPRPWPRGDGGIAPNPSAALAAVTDRSFAGTDYGAGTKTTGVLVVRRGRIVAENYADTWGPYVSNRTWSVAKSIAGTLVGIAAQEGHADVMAPAAIPEWSKDDPRAAITLDNLLRMASGLHNPAAGSRTDDIYFGGATVVESAVARPIEAPAGKRFLYSNADILVAMRSLRQTTGDTYQPLPYFHLFRGLGMEHTLVGMDWRYQDFILSSQVWSTARDLARLGQFWLDDGVMRGERLLPEGWMKYATTPSGPQPDGEFGYGATFWLMNRSPGVPADTFAAFGNRGQYVVVVPSRRIVIVRRGEDPGKARFDIAKFTADVLAATQ